MQGQEAMSGIGAFIPLILVFVVFYFMLIRPQKKREKQLKEMIASLKVGDEVATIGGIHGKISRIKDDIFVLETGVGTTKSYVSIERGSIARRTKEAIAKADEVEVAPLTDTPEEAE